MLLINRFRDTFQISLEELQYHSIYDLANEQWDIPELRLLLANIIAESTPCAGIEIAREFAPIGSRVLLLNGRRIYANGKYTKKFSSVLKILPYIVTERGRYLKQTRH